MKSTFWLVPAIVARDTPFSSLLLAKAQWRKHDQSEYISTAIHFSQTALIFTFWGRSQSYSELPAFTRQISLSLCITSLTFSFSSFQSLLCLNLLIDQSESRAPKKVRNDMRHPGKPVLARSARCPRDWDESVHQHQELLLSEARFLSSRLFAVNLGSERLCSFIWLRLSLFPSLTSDQSHDATCLMLACFCLSLHIFASFILVFCQGCFCCFHDSRSSAGKSLSYHRCRESNGDISCSFIILRKAPLKIVDTLLNVCSQVMPAWYALTFETCQC